MATLRSNKEIVMKNTGKSNHFTHRIHDHEKWSILLNIRLTQYMLYACMTAVKMGPNLSEILKGKLNLGARILQEGGRGNIFKNVFGMEEKEQLLKASQCYLYTTNGPIAGILFVSTEKVAFYSERPITFSSATGGLVRAPSKVSIPIRRIKEVNESHNVNNVEQKYIQIVTKDGSGFWFVGFLLYEKALKNLNKAISTVNQM
ncbi:hypothetical protein VNO78_32585 [Psophocarpus tetragonolobus]|uniref:GRAM domain-containing protein n=1 Tax=Psophocarpus tetragonolobus TaxID=3891 RepID=A0AAN9P2U8_PSOTE